TNQERRTQESCTMESSLWPEVEHAPVEEQPLLQVARLRRFGVNYLKDAVCPGLGLLAHLDGSSVRLLAFPSRSGQGGLVGGAPGRVVAVIDLKARLANMDPGDSGKRSAAPDEGLARGLSWSRCNYSAAASTSGDAGSDGARCDRGRDKVCHIAVACGSKVGLWEVSRGARAASAAKEGTRSEDGYRYTTVKVRTDWERSDDQGSCETSAMNGTSLCDRLLDGDGGSLAKACNKNGGKSPPPPVGNVRCLSFRPWAGGSTIDAAIPLAAWYDVGVAVLGPRGSRVVLPAPVARKRTCGAWSGCGRGLALSSGGEIRVYSDPSEGGSRRPTSTAGHARGGVESETIGDAPGLQPAKPRSGWASPGSVAAAAVNDNEVGGEGGGGALPSATVAREGGLVAEGETGLTGCSGGASREFHTVLCVEAAMGGDVFSSPGSSPGSTRSSPSPLADGGGGARSGGDGTGLTRTGAPPGTRRSRPERASDGTHSSVGPLSPPPAATTARVSSSRLLIGDMRAMCPAGSLAFFGTTGGGLGLDSAIAASGPTLSGEPLLADGGGQATHVGEGLLGAVVDSSNKACATSSSIDTVSAEKPATRRGGFRHSLPGENWLAGSLRPTSRTLLPNSPRRRGRDSGSPESPLALPVGSSPVAPLEERSSTAAEESVPAGESRPTSSESSLLHSAIPEVVDRRSTTPEVVDLRGKLGNGADGGGAAGMPMASTHPLFRLSLPGGEDAASSPAVGSSSISLRDSGNRLRRMGTASGRNSHAAGRTTDVTPGRRPCLVRVSCRSGGGDGVVGVATLASLPSELASPDLLASSEDGRIVAVGSHACDLVACYRLESHPASPATESCLPGGSGGSESGTRTRKRRHRRAVPLCTLRLPTGYRAKGLMLSREMQARGESAATPGVHGSASRQGATAEDGVMADEVVVLVLAGCAVSSVDATIGTTTPRPDMNESSFAAESHWRGSNSGRPEESSYRTTLLRFSLPAAPATTGNGEDLGSLVGSAAALPSTSSNTSGCGHEKETTAGSSENLSVVPSDTRSPLVGDTYGAERNGLRSRGGDSSRHPRSEAAVLEAIVGVERRMNERMDRIEGMLAGVCDRLEELSARLPHAARDVVETRGAHG
ncbi:unnamed protein product, partial [Ectocarpus sp. 4 AP-2014]